MFQKCCIFLENLSFFGHFGPKYTENVSKMAKKPLKVGISGQNVTLFGLITVGYGQLAGHMWALAAKWRLNSHYVGHLGGYLAKPNGYLAKRGLYMYTTRVKSMRRSRVFCYWGLGIVIELEVNERSE